MNYNDFAIPGMLPMPRPNASSSCLAALPDGSLRIKIFEQPIDKIIVPQFNIDIRDLGDNLILKPGRSYVFRLAPGSLAEYWLMVPASDLCLKPGFVFLHVFVTGGIYTRLEVEVQDTPFLFYRTQNDMSEFTPSTSGCLVGDVLRGDIPLNMGDTEASVTFQSLKLGNRYVAVTIYNAQDPQADRIIREVKCVNTDGFKVSFPNEIPGAGYYLGWAAW